MAGKIIDIEGAGGRAFTVKDTPTMCRHMQTEIDTHSRMVVCTACNKVIDPYDYMLNLALTERTERWQFREIKALRNKLQSEVEELQRQVTNLKAQKRRLNS